MWLAIALSGYFLLAVVAILDKFIVSDERLAPSVVTFFSSAPLLALVFLLPFGVNSLQSWHDAINGLVSGGAFVCALWAMYRGFEKSEVSHAGPLIGAVVPLATLAFGAWFAVEALSPRLVAAVGFLVVGSLIISFEQKKKSSGWHRGMLWIIVAGILFAVSNLAAKYMYTTYGFYSGLVWTRLAMGVVGILFLLVPRVWNTLFGAKKKSVAKHRFSSTGTRIVTVATDKLLGVVGAVLVQYAVALGSVTLVNALTGAQYAFLIVLVAISSKLFPKLFKEEYTRTEIFQEIAAVACIGVGFALLIV